VTTRVFNHNQKPVEKIILLNLVESVRLRRAFKVLFNTRRAAWSIMCCISSASAEGNCISSASAEGNCISSASAEGNCISSASAEGNCISSASAEVNCISSASSCRLRCVVSMSSEDTPVAPDAAASRRTPRLDAAAVVNAAEFPSKSRKPAQRKLTAKQQMKAKRMKERDENKAKKQKQQELRASYSALTPCKTTLDLSEREPTVGDKLIVRDEYNFKSGARCAVARSLLFTLCPAQVPRHRAEGGACQCRHAAAVRCAPRC
jgi:hypothetical protein